MGESDSGRKNFKRSAAYPNGSTAAMRGAVIEVLSVLKVATADQLHRIINPELTDSRFVRHALLDLQRHQITASDGRTPTRHKIWRLTGPGLDSATAVRENGPATGGTAKGAGLTGAPHAMAVNEAIIACLPDTGTIASWTTEVEHPIATRQVVRTDAVLQAPELGLPVVFFETDRGTMKESLVAAKIPRYLDYLTRNVRTSGGDDVLHWHRLYGRPDHSADKQHPPIALVFDGGTRLGPTALHNRIDRIGDLTHQHWGSRPYRVGYEIEPLCRDYSGTVPLLATTLDRLQCHGLTDGPTWWRYGHDTWEPLAQALANPDGYAAYLRRCEDERAEKQRREAERKEAERQRQAAREQAQQRREAAQRAVEQGERPDIAQIWARRQVGPDGSITFPDLDQAADPQPSTTPPLAPPAPAPPAPRRRFFRP